MNPRIPSDQAAERSRRRWPHALVLALLASALSASPSHASLFKGETLDAVANGIAWVVLVLVPVVGIGLFWMVHILPEKIAEKRKHPQAKAIQTLCLLSLVFGGMLWPLAFLWAYSKPVLYKLAYGTDTVEHGHGAKPPAAAPQAAAEAEVKDTPAATPAVEGGKA
jgi:hypothetical protein